MTVSFIPHWNNAEGGVDLDTSRCFVGMERFEQWRALTPPENVVVGLDEHSGIIMDFDKQICDVHGVSSVTVAKQNSMEIYPAGAKFPFSELGALSLPASLKDGIRSEAWEMIEQANKPEDENLSAEVMALLEQRKQVRASKDFAESDRLRDAISALGWTVKDTKDGQQLEKR
jgi:hypothetical protein